MNTKTSYKLRFPKTAHCIVQDCRYPVAHVLNIRIRREDTGAVYGPNIDGAYLCEVHGKSGADFELRYTPRSDGLVTTKVEVDGREVARMVRPVTGGHPGQSGLF